MCAFVFLVPKYLVVAVVVVVVGFCRDMMHTLRTLTCACANTHLHAQVLDYWRHFNDGYGAEEPDLFEVVPPRFGRLLAFDGRLPHGVRRVTGPQSMANGNSVEHSHSVDS